MLSLNPVPDSTDYQYMFSKTTEEGSVAAFLSWCKEEGLDHRLITIGNNFKTIGEDKYVYKTTKWMVCGQIPKHKAVIVKMRWGMRQ